MKKINIIVILLVAISLVTFKYTWRNSVHHLSSTSKIIPSKTLKDSVLKTEIKINQETKILHRKNDSLNKQLVHIKLLYEQSQVKVKLLQTALQQRITKDTSKNILQRISNCDSIKQDAILFITQSNTSDSLCEQKNCELETVIVNKNVELQLVNDRYDKLKTDFNKSLQQQDYLQKDNQYLFKTAQRKTFSNRLLSAGLLVFVSATAINILQHHY
ncbi:MAG: hypothetical protein RJA07_481 [Bacteroidota bacterium]|jgi:hypothetical protein